MAINKEYDTAEMQGVKGGLKRKFASGVDGKTVPALFLKNISAPSLESVLFGGLGVLIIGGMGLSMTLDLTEYVEPANIEYGLAEGVNSYQGFNNEYVLQMTQGGDYALYEASYGDDGFVNELDYLTRPGDAIGALYNIRADLQAIRDKILTGRPLDDTESAYMFSLESMTVIHEEEEGSIERETGDMITDSMARQDMLAKINYILPIVENALENIYEREQYGLPQSQIDARPKSLTEGEALARGFGSAAFLYSLILLGSSLNGARRETQSQMRRAKSKKEKGYSFP